MHNYSILLLILLFGITGAIYAADFRDGYIIDNANDTTYGCIHYEGVFQNPKVCLFRNEPSAKTRAYLPQELKAFRFTDSRYFVRKELQNEGTSEAVFMEFLINGKVNLYSIYENGSLRYFAGSSDSMMVELKKEDKIVYVNGKKYLRESRKYIGILKYLFSESPDIMQQVETVDLTQKALVGIARDYHTEVCDGEACIIYEKSLKPRNNRVQFGPMAGISAYSFSSFSHWDYDFSTTVYPSIGLFVKKNLPLLHDKVFVQYEALYGHDYLFGKKLDYTLMDIDHYDCIHYERNSILNTLLLKREYNFGKTTLNWHLGAFVDYAFHSNYKHTFEAWNKAEEVLETPVLMDNNNPYANTGVGFLLGTGLTIPFSEKFALIIDLRYQKGMGTRTLSPDNTTKQFLTFNLGFAFGK